MFSGAQKATFLFIDNGKKIITSLGVDDLGTLHIDMLRQLGRSFRSFDFILEE